MTATVDVTSPQCPSIPRAPAVTVAVGLSIGIAVDANVAIPWSGWLVSATAALMLWYFTHRTGHLAGAAAWLCLTCVFVGAARHHQVSSAASANHIASYATDVPRLIKLEGVVESHPEIISADDSQPEWQQVDRTRCTLRCRALHGDAGILPVDGLVLLDVDGAVRHLDVGTRVEVVGTLASPIGPRNPGEFDYRDYLQRKGVRAILRTRVPEAIRSLGDEPQYLFRKTTTRLRARCEGILERELSPNTAPVANALLLGSRTQMDDEIRTIFAESGAMHLLAVSGLHVGILLQLMWFGCRAVNLSRMLTSLVLIVSVLAYAVLTDARPPVVRASILIAVWVGGRPHFRRSIPANTLAIAASIVLLWNPTDLFDIGAQLSFLAVIAILWSTRRLHEETSDTARTARESALEGSAPWRVWLKQTGRWLFAGYHMTGAIWLFTIPLVVSNYHLVAPIGLIINVLLIPVVTLALWLGYLLLLCGLVAPWITFTFAVGLEWALQLLLWLVHSTARLPMGHLYVSGPGSWWVYGCYALLAVLAMNANRDRWTRVGLRGLFAWTAIGLCAGIVETRPTGLRCTFLAVGHGCAIVIQTPDRKVLVYDAGSLNSGERARRIVQGCLWDQGLARIDGMIISHADVDHLNAVPGLLRAIPTGDVLVSRQFLDFTQEGVVDVCEAASSEGVPIRLLSTGDRIQLDPNVKIQVLHPELTFDSRHDNANSLVLMMEYQGRRILLCGDLEEEGLERLMQSEPHDFDVVLAPHHGSLRANPRRFAEWAHAEYVVVSGGRVGLSQALSPSYGADTRIMTTDANGAIIVQITPDGRLESHSLAQEPSE